MQHLIFNLILFSFLFAPIVKHPVHVSIANVEFNQETNVFDMSLKLFIDDFEAVIKHNYNVELNLSKENELKEYEKYINQYIQKQFAIRINNSDKPQILIYKSKKINDLSLWLYFEFKAIDNIKTLKIDNNLMNDYYFDQTNLLIFTYRDFQHGYRFDYENTTVDILIDK